MLQIDNNNASHDREPGLFSRYAVVIATCFLGGGALSWWLFSTAFGPKPFSSLK